MFLGQKEEQLRSRLMLDGCFNLDWTLTANKSLGGLLFKEVSLVQNKLLLLPMSLWVLPLWHLTYLDDIQKTKTQFIKQVRERPHLLTHNCNIIDLLLNLSFLFYLIHKILNSLLLDKGNSIWINAFFKNRLQPVCEEILGVSEKMVLSWEIKYWFYDLARHLK